MTFAQLKVSMFIGIFVLLGFKAGAQRAFFADQKTSLALAHEAYLEGDFKGMIAKLTEAMRNSPADQLVKENARALMRSAFAVKKSSLPEIVELPDGVEKMTVASRRINGGKFPVEVKGTLKSGIKPVELKLIAFPDRVVLDMNASDSEYYLTDAGEYYLKRPLAQAPSDGLYRIVARFSNGSSLDQWIPIFDFVAPNFPRAIQPAHDSFTTDANPVLKWEMPAEDQSRSSQRKSSIQVVQNESPDWKWEIKWALYMVDQQKRRATVGREPKGNGVNFLEKGRYILNVISRDERKLGGLTISVESVDRNVFHVK